jgi:hypothetical protein
VVQYFDETYRGWLICLALDVIGTSRGAGRSCHRSVGSDANMCKLRGRI